jgi:hypothetical protein
MRFFLSFASFNKIFKINEGKIAFDTRAEEAGISWKNNGWEKIALFADVGVEVAYLI